MTDLLARAEQDPASLTRADLVRLLAVADSAPFTALEAAARRVREALTGKAVYLRGLIEMGNRCAKDCRYCGLRRSNRALHRYTIPEVNCLRMARWARAHGYGSIVLQSGELESEENTARIERILRALRAEGGEQLGITLSLGEQTPEVYRRERGLRAGANVVMPNITDRLYRADYQLYENKPYIGEDPLKCRGCLEARIRLAGCTVAWHTPGTPKHYQEAR